LRAFPLLWLEKPRALDNHCLPTVSGLPDREPMPRLFLACLLLVCSGLARAAEVLDLRVWPLLDRTRVEIAVAGELDHRIFSVEGPDRLVVDLTRATWSAPAAASKVQTRELSGLRWGRRNRDDLRLVFDLAGPVELESSVLGVRSEGGRGSWLVIEVLPRNRRALPWPASASEPERPSRGDIAVRAGVGAAAAEPSALPAPPASSSGPAGGPQRESPPRMAAAAPEAQPVQAPRPAAPARPTPVMERAWAAEAPATGPASSARKPRRTLVVAIDAGHGGVDPGAAGRHGTREKDVTLAVARELATLVNREPGMRAVLVRDRDVFIPLRRRMQIARENGADLFLSIHADAFHQREVRGSSVYVLSERGASNEQARLLAERENAVDLLGGVSLDHPDPMVRSVILDLAQTGTQQASERAAGELLQALAAVTSLHSADVQHAAFAVLKSPDVPSVLVETAYISNPDEERRLADRRHQRVLARALFSGIRAYFGRNAASGALIAERDLP
jgi:N-acetylmuramoyl-L-alanine amidase